MVLTIADVEFIADFLISFDVLHYGKQLTSDHFDCDGERFVVKTFVYDTHFYYIYMKNGTYKHFYRLD